MQATHGNADTEPTQPRSWLKRNAADIWWLAALLGGAVVVFLATRGTGYQQLGMGLLSAAVALLVLMAAFEAIWQATARGLASQ